MTEEKKPEINKFELAVNNLEHSLLSSTEIKRTFERSWLEKFQKENLDVPQRYLIDMLHQAQLTGANPVTKQVYLVSYFDKRLGHKVGATVYSYHFFNAMAERSGGLDGLTINTEAEDVFCPFTMESKKMLVSTATVVKNGRESKFKARWNEFYKANNPMWNNIPYTMLEKCAIAGGLRRAFPGVLSGAYIEEEIFSEFKEKNLVEVEAEITSGENQISLEVKDI